MFTVGHSNRSLAEFVALLHEYDIGVLVDVRSYPYSKRHPQFNGPDLERELPLAGIRYRWLGRELGGMRKEGRADSRHTALEQSGMRNYADHMETPQFAEGIERLLEESGDARTACMCAEKDWHICHRRFLSDALEALHGRTVKHIREKTELLPHERHELARVVDGVLVYDAGGQHQASLF